MPSLEGENDLCGEGEAEIDLGLRCEGDSGTLLITLIGDSLPSRDNRGRLLGGDSDEEEEPPLRFAVFSTGFGLCEAGDTESRDNCRGDGEPVLFFEGDSGWRRLGGGDSDNFCLDGDQRLLGDGDNRLRFAGGERLLGGGDGEYLLLGGGGEYDGRRRKGGGDTIPRRLLGEDGDRRLGPGDSLRLAGGGEGEARRL